MLRSIRPTRAAPKSRGSSEFGRSPIEQTKMLASARCHSMRSSSRQRRAKLKDLFAQMPLRKATCREGTWEEFAGRFA